MRSPYDDFAAASDFEESKNSAIPYHARENSLPFSYGQITKTSTPLRSVAMKNESGTSGLYRESNNRSNGINKIGGYNYISHPSKDENFNLNNDLRYGIGYSPNDKIRTSLVPDNGTDGATIKTQPRLTSPLLVRKTLNSRSPTRSATSTTNTISNTYPYQYGESGNANGLNGSAESQYSAKLNYNNNNIYSNSGLRKTPTRSDFEDLLRERRERVFNEYRSGHDMRASSLSPSPTSPTAGSTIHKGRPPHPPQPPQRMYTNANGNSLYSDQLRNQRGHSASKYNYDFEFNLNLDDLPRRPNTIERASSLQYRSGPRPFDAPAQREAAHTYVERNYHTISKRGETSYPYEERPPLELTQNRRYGNGNAAGSANSTFDEVDNSRRIYEQLREGHTPTTGFSSSHRAAAAGPNDDLSPIYATTTKQTKQVITRTSQEEPMQQHNYLSETMATSHSPRPETPAFPVTPRTPYGSNHASSPQPHSPLPRRLLYAPHEGLDLEKYNSETIYQTTYRSRLGSGISLVNSEPQEVAAHLVKFAKDSSKFWYKPNISREDAISLLLNAPPGTFLIRNSTTYKDAYGLVLRVAQPPPGSTSDKPDELVRHFLIEPTKHGVRLKGSANEPVFTSLSAFVYEHSVNQIALPCLLRIPEQDIVPLAEPTPAQRQLLTQGAACNVLWLYSSETESLTGVEAIRKAIRQLYEQKPLPTPTVVHFKVSPQGITLTDNTRKKFFRKHYTSDVISFCALDPDNHMWSYKPDTGDNNISQVGELKKTIFAFVARRSPSCKDNQCHVFSDLATNQPASAIVSFVNKILPTEKQRNYVL